MQIRKYVYRTMLHKMTTDTINCSRTDMIYIFKHTANKFTVFDREFRLVKNLKI